MADDRVGGVPDGHPGLVDPVLERTGPRPVAEPGEHVQPDELTIRAEQDAGQQITRALRRVTGDRRLEVLQKPEQTAAGGHPHPALDRADVASAEVRGDLPDQSRLRLPVDHTDHGPPFDTLVSGHVPDRATRLVERVGTAADSEDPHRVPRRIEHRVPRVTPGNQDPEMQTSRVLRLPRPWTRAPQSEHREEQVVHGPGQRQRYGDGGHPQPPFVGAHGGGAGRAGTRGDRP
ncbi:hypothetical protein AOZ06_19405 [Kibdelosporangium phytohabitans]|uniref:Uncharacterized protein n=1 Tax=Kibdelosporangium phytohabitans TaxID=860235 RepID=A0A0N9I2T9_9PSEU|nr:hypothetical protein AOZ06_19405 [Kibdelosporangium phytohabitans]